MWGMNSNLIEKDDVVQMTVPPLKLSIQSRTQSVEQKQYDNGSLQQMKDAHAAPPLLDPGFSNRPRQTRGTAALANEVQDLSEAVNTAVIPNQVVQNNTNMNNLSAIANDAINWHTSAKSEVYSETDAFYTHPSFTREKKVIRVLGSNENENRVNRASWMLSPPTAVPVRRPSEYDEFSPRVHQRLSQYGDASPLPMLGGTARRQPSPVHRRPVSPTNRAKPSMTLRRRSIDTMRPRHTVIEQHQHATCADMDTFSFKADSKATQHVHKHMHYHVVGTATNATSTTTATVMPVQTIQTHAQVMPVMTQQMVPQTHTQLVQMVPQSRPAVQQVMVPVQTVQYQQVQQPTMQTVQVQPMQQQVITVQANPTVQTVQMPVQQQVVTVQAKPTMQTVQVPVQTVQYQQYQQPTMQTVQVVEQPKVIQIQVPVQQQQHHQQHVQTITMPQQHMQTITMPQQQTVQYVQQPVQQVMQTVSAPRQKVTGMHTLTVAVPAVHTVDQQNINTVTTANRSQVPVVVSFPGQPPVQAVGVYGYMPVRQDQQQQMMYGQQQQQQMGYPGYQGGYPGYGYPAYGKTKKDKDSKDKKGKDKKKSKK